jgi:flagellar hook protein FlgE
MAFQQGLSGLASSARALDVISSNVANASTVGFKASNAVFADNFASAMTGAMSSIQVGAGGMVNTVRQSFAQGGLTTTSNPLDMAINGAGFFQIERTNGTTAYSRNGQFDLDKDGYIVTPLGEKLMGFQTRVGDTVSLAGTGTPTPIYVPPQGLGAKATESANIRANLDSSEGVKTGPIDPEDPETYNSMTSIRLYDSLGNEHQLSLYFGKTATPNLWNVQAYVDGGATAVATQTLNFTESGLPRQVLPPVPPATTGAPDPAYANFTLNLTAPVTTGAEDLNFSVSLTGLTQRNAAFSVTELRQDGYPPGEIAGVSVTSDGIVQGRYSNGQTQNLGQVVLASFRNPNGLVSLGNNLWAETTESGQPAVGIPGAGLNGTLSSGQIEESNVDMSQELVQMIIQQRNYQANAQSIRTQDQILQTLINLR